MGFVIQSESSNSIKIKSNIRNFKIQNMAASSNMIVKDKTDEKEKKQSYAFKEVEFLLHE